MPPDDPAAVRSRKELQLINRLMGNGRWLSKRVRHHLRDGDKVLEVGAGDGALAVRSFPHKIDYAGLDLAPRPDGIPSKWAWRQSDFLQADLDGDILVANLFLHHFTDTELRSFGARLAASSVRVVLVAEPHRQIIHQWQGRLLYPFGLSQVTRHDMQISIAAGFRQGELPSVLGATSERWRAVESQTFLGSMRMELVRNSMGKDLAKEGSNDATGVKNRG